MFIVVLLSVLWIFQSIQTADQLILLTEFFPVLHDYFIIHEEFWINYFKHIAGAELHFPFVCKLLKWIDLNNKQSHKAISRLL